MANNIKLEEVLASPLLTEGAGILQGINRRIEGRAWNQHAHILYTLGKLHGDCSTYLELGVMHGATMCLMSRVLAQAETPLAIGVDWFTYFNQRHLDPISRMEVTPRVMIRNFNIYNPAQKVHLQLVKGDTNSKESIAKVYEILGDRTVDMLFLDSTYQPEQIAKDFDAYSNKMSTGGIMVFAGYNEMMCRKWIDNHDFFGYNIIGAFENMFILQRMKRSGAPKPKPEAVETAVSVSGDYTAPVMKELTLKERKEREMNMRKRREERQRRMRLKKAERAKKLKTAPINNDENVDELLESIK